MKNYFLLQMRLAYRRSQSWGVHPLGLLLIGLTLFVVLAEYLYSKTSYAPYILIIGGIQTTAQLNGMQRNEYLKIVFSSSQYLKVRLCENLIVLLPFLILLLCHKDLLPALILGILGALLIGYRRIAHQSSSLYTPFGTKLYEFAQGFRRTYLISALLFFLLAAGVSYQNFNLSIFSFIILFLIMGQNYQTGEPDFFIWSFDRSSKKFIRLKIQYLVYNASILTLPMGIILGLFFPENWMITILIFFIGHIYLLNMLLAKYASHPGSISMPYGILVTISLILAPMLIPTAVFFYWKSLQKIRPLLS